MEPGYEPIADAMVANQSPFENDPGDLGAAIAIHHHGRLVVDVRCGHIDPERTVRWQADTLVNAYSTMKPVAAVLALQAVADGLLDLDQPIADVWPEFAEHGKDGITLRHALAHQAGLPAIRPLLADDDLYDWDAMCSGLAATSPFWEPGRAHGYHTNTFGFVVGEPVCRVRNTTFTEAVQHHIARPLGIDLHVGVPHAELGRVAPFQLPQYSPPTDPQPAEAPSEHDQMLSLAYWNPSGASGMNVVNTTRWRTAAVPSTNGHATAQALAGFYRALLADVPSPLLPRELVDEATTEHASGIDEVLLRPIRFGLGFTLPQPDRPIGLTSSAFGHYGFGGSLGFADPAEGIAFGYLTNRPGERWQNPRVKRLLGALADCV